MKRLSAVEIFGKENGSPFVKMKLKISDIDGKENANVITIPKEEIPVLLTGDYRNI